MKNLKGISLGLMLLCSANIGAFDTPLTMQKSVETISTFIRVNKPYVERFLKEKVMTKETLKKISDTQKTIREKLAKANFRKIVGGLISAYRSSRK